MSDLLKRKPKKIERSQTLTPRTIFSSNDLPEQIKEEAVEKKPVIKNTPTVAEKTTTVRVSVAMKNKLNAMVTLGIADTVDQLTDVLIDEYVSNILSKDEKKQLEIILDLYKSKSNNK
ncbi:DUF5388 domain-containing protein [Planococcus sp. ISL-109]|uniref:DUF5388 domain-containing protein n=1 Tax=Planococcus sp. ISL-109 TaxID=2819166 RepID=UPI001BEA1547|nr:DUF5388 domain-containing protein [Planococcus sp. ISL-109]MBT2583142.1 hypothetical protein [Planococcus sp. ISL-109]